MNARCLVPCVVSLWVLHGTFAVGAEPGTTEARDEGQQVGEIESDRTVVTDAQPPAVSDSVLRVFFTVDWLSYCSETTRREFVEAGFDDRRSEPYALLTMASWSRQYATVIEVAARMLETAAEVGDPVGEALAFHLRGQALGDLAISGQAVSGEANEAVFLLRTAAEAWARAGAGPESAAALTDALPVLLYTSGDRESIDTLIQEAVHVAESESTRPLASAEVLYNSGDFALRAMGAIPESRRLLEASLRVRERAAPVSTEVASSLQALGFLESLQGNASAALAYLERALALAEMLADRSSLHANILFSFGSVYLDLGDLWSAEDNIRRALEIRQVLAPDSVRARGGVAECLNALGVIHYYRDNVRQCKEYFEQTLGIWEELLPESAAVPSVLQNLGRCTGRSGDFSAAAKYYSRALALAEQRLPDSPQVAEILYQMGADLHAKGDLAEASTYLARSHAILERLQPDSTTSAWVQCELGAVARDRGQISDARSYHEQALKVLADLAPGSRDVADAELDLGEDLVVQGDYPGAKTHFLRALAIVEGLGDNPPSAPPILYQLGDLSAREGRFAEAEKYYRKATTILENNLGPSHFFLSDGFDRLACVLQQQGQAEQALEAALRAERIRVEHLRLSVRFLPEPLALRYASWRNRALDVALDLASNRFASDPDQVRRVWDVLVKSRALVLDEMARRHLSARGTSDPQIRALVETYASASARAARLAMRGPGEEPAATYRRVLDEATTEKNQAEEELARKASYPQSAIEFRAVHIRDIASNLPPKAALVAIVLVDRSGCVGRPRDPSNASRPARSYVAFVLSEFDRSPSAVFLGGTDEIDSLVAQVRRLAVPPGAPGGVARRAEANYRHAAEQLRRRVWDPITPLLGTTETVFVVPDGALSLVDFAALPTGDSGYLVETGPRLHYLSAERDLIGFGEASGQGLLAVGDPAFDEAAIFAALRAPGVELPQAPLQLASATVFRGQPPSCGDFGSLHFAPLPATATEVDDVVSAWSGSLGEPGLRLRGADVPTDAQVLVGASAAEFAVKLMAPGRDVLHLATHGFFLGEGCPSALDVGRGAAGAPWAAAVSGQNPLLLSGFALAGANHRDAAGPDEEDGILTAEEIAAMDLSGVRWAVLSGCDTGLGEIRAGEGVLGLRRAFQVAGAHTVVMSLWPVEDEASREWMRALYANRFSRGMSTVEAVRAASLERLRQRRAAGESTHPFHWAGFIASGDWR